jgi:hypothetical protein
MQSLETPAFMALCLALAICARVLPGKRAELVTIPSMNIDDRILLFRRIIWLSSCCVTAAILYGLFEFLAERNVYASQDRLVGDIFDVSWIVLCVLLRICLAKIDDHRLAVWLRRDREFRYDGGVRARQEEAPGVVDNVFVWSANIFVLALLATYVGGYVLLAQKSGFASPVVTIFTGALTLSAILGSIARIFISPRTLLAHALTFTCVVLVVASSLGALESTGVFLIRTPVGSSTQVR